MKLCECGCGQPAPIAKKSDSRLGHIKGQPTRFVNGHHNARTTAKGKFCPKCQQVLPLERFSKNTSKRGGVASMCRECTASYMSEYRSVNRGQIARLVRKHRDTPKGKEGMRREAKRNRQQRPEVLRARRLVNYAISRGDLVRRPCQFCGNENSQAHHYDYSEPLSVIWACFVCHREKIHGHKVVAKEEL